MEAIKDTVTGVMQTLAAKKIESKASPEALLKKALAKNQLKHIKFNYFKKGILSVNVDSSSWLYSLSLQKENLLSKLKQRLRLIKDIHFRLGETK